MKVTIFPGQGSQHKGMGGEYFDLYPERVAISDELLGYSVKDKCLYDREKQLSLTQYTQPLLYIVNSLSHLHHESRHATRANYFVGHSLGEYNALLASDVFDFEVGLKIIKKRGELMAGASGGGMAAVINIEVKKLQGMLIDSKLDSIDIANFNSPQQTVISGPSDDLKLAKQLFKDLGEGMFVDLPASAPFHSRYMQDCATEFSDYLMQFSFRDPKVPVLSNVTAQPHRKEHFVELLTKQLYSPVRWTDTIINLIRIKANDFTELGPGQVLSKLVRQIISTETL
ncbi:MAG: ACP S-malonyltransferase [Candidatus Sedimenticola sp. (ex Thyasira tokunagai)]